MSLSLDDVYYLTSAAGRDALQAFAAADISSRNTLPLLLQMRKSLTPERAAAVLTTLRLRHKARAKFPRHAQEMLFTEAGLQQASDPQIRAYRSRTAGADSLLDVCCGIGSDAIAFAQRGANILGIDHDPVALAIARHNAAVIDAHVDFRLGDARDSLPSGYAAIFFDPARRDSDGRRIHHVERYQPPLSTIRAWQARAIIVKLSPAVDLTQLADYGGQVEFISVSGQLKEALLWLARPSSPPLATRIDASGVHHMAGGERFEIPLSEPRAWLLEPDPAILRSRALRRLAAQLGASLLDETIAWLTLDSAPETPWGRCFRVLDWMPFSLKRLRRYLLERHVGKVTVKKRGFPMLPEELIARLRLKGGGESRLLIATRCLGQHIIAVCADESP